MTTRRCGFLLAAALLGMGCASPAKPPLVNLWERPRVALLPVAGDPADPALAADLRADLGAALRALAATEVVDDARTAAVPFPAGSAAASPWTNAGWRTAAAAAAGGGLILTGSVREFRESALPEKPRRIRSQVDTSWKWGVSDTATAHCAATLVLVEAATGRIVWTRIIPGDGKDARWTDLAWPGDNTSAPPGGWDALLLRVRPPLPAGALHYPADTSAARARRNAIGEIVTAALTDFTGHDGWEPPAKK